MSCCCSAWRLPKPPEIMGIREEEIFSANILPRQSRWWKILHTKNKKKKPNFYCKGKIRPRGMQRHPQLALPSPPGWRGCAEKSRKDVPTGTGDGCATRKWGQACSPKPHQDASHVWGSVWRQQEGGVGVVKRHWL